MISPALQQEIEQALGHQIIAMAPLSAANKAQIWRLTFEDKTNVVAKIAEYGLDIEAYMMEYLRTKTNLPIPKIYYSNEYVIVMDFVNGQSVVDEEAQHHAAALLSALHDIHADQYGHEQDTLIAGFKQPNPRSSDWVSFFAEQRLLYMAEEALKEGKIDNDFMKKLDKLVVKLSGILRDPQKPSLVHGDIWGGNLLAGRGKILAFLDPAIYYADPEIELAYIRLQHTFDGSFFATYNEKHAIEPGFYEERADIYALYPLLVHARLFGTSYARKALKILERFV